jgi:hypothetical protein
MALSERDKNKNFNKKCYEYYRETDDRGFDIINFDKNYNKYKNMLTLKDHKNNWDILKEKSSLENTFNKTNIYQDKYDYSDAENNLFKFKEKRNSKFNFFNFYY